MGAQGFRSNPINTPVARVGGAMISGIGCMKALLRGTHTLHPKGCSLAKRLVPATFLTGIARKGGMVASPGSHDGFLCKGMTRMHATVTVAPSSIDLKAASML